MSTQTLSRPRTTIKADVRDVRPLLSRDIHYIVKTETLVASMASQIVDEQHDHQVRETVAWGMGTFDVIPVSRGRAAKSLIGIAVDVETRIIRAVGNGEITHRVAVEAVFAEILPVYGRQVRVKGWLPGHRIAGTRDVLEITDDTCPNCVVNPIGFRAGDAKVARCLNTEECGWTSA